MAIRAKLTTLDSTSSSSSSNSGAGKPERSEEEKAARKDRVQKAKDALTRSATLKGDHVPPARTALKTFLQNLNAPRQPDDATCGPTCLQAAQPQQLGSRCAHR